MSRPFPPLLPAHAAPPTIDDLLAHALYGKLPGDKPATPQKLGPLNDPSSVVGQLADTGHALLRAAGVQPFGPEDPSGYETSDLGPDRGALLESLGVPRYTTDEKRVAQMVFHGSPHVFDEFDAAKIGTGEGAQAYGHGLYFAENPEIAGTYTTAGPNRPTSRLQYDGADVSTTVKPWDQQNPRDFAVMVLSGSPSGLGSDQKAEAVLRAATRLKDFKVSGSNVGLFRDAPSSWLDDLSEVARTVDTSKIRTVAGGNLYSATIPDEHADRMLAWDKPLSEQSDSVKAALRAAGHEPGSIKYPSLKQAMNLFEGMPAQRAAYADIGTRDVYREGYKLAKAGDEEGFRRWFAAHGSSLSPTRKQDQLGEAFYHDLASDRPRVEAPSWRGGGAIDYKGASEYLDSIGIPGIKYFDANSRAFGTRAFDVQWAGDKARVIDRVTGRAVEPDFDSFEAADKWVAEHAPPVKHNFVVFDPRILKDVKRK